MDVLGRITGAGVEEDIDMAAVAAVVAAEAEAVEAKVDLYLTVHGVAGPGRGVLVGVSLVVSPSSSSQKFSWCI